MPTVDESRSLLAAGASYNAGDWASVGAETSLDMIAVANLDRGVDIGLGVEALARLDGVIRQYIAADVNGQAHAAARVRAQVQMPLVLFDEAGIAVRLQAVAEAAVGAQLGIGLALGDFLALAGSDPRLRKIPIELAICRWAPRVRGKESSWLRSDVARSWRWPSYLRASPAWRG